MKSESGFNFAMASQPFPGSLPDNFHVNFYPNRLVVNKFSKERRRAKSDNVQQYAKSSCIKG